MLAVHSSWPRTEERRTRLECGNAASRRLTDRRGEDICSVDGETDRFLCPAYHIHTAPWTENWLPVSRRLVPLCAASLTPPRILELAKAAAAVRLAAQGPQAQAALCRLEE